MPVHQGFLSKMRALAGEPARYSLVLDDLDLPLNNLLGHSVQLKFTGSIRCSHCGENTAKSYGQGHCYACFTELARCDLCVMSPDRCHFHRGTCREPDWGQAFCMQPHLVYLANSSGIKVGITRSDRLPIRWIDQGAVQAVPIFATPSRRIAGLIESIYKSEISDRTQWQRMLMADDLHIDLANARTGIGDKVYDAIMALSTKENLNFRDVSRPDDIEAPAPSDVTRFTDAEITTLSYPVLGYPSRVVALDPARSPDIQGQLLGIKGQYLILDTGVINIRRYTSYHLRFESSDTPVESRSPVGQNSLF